jgi:hypothetical protein
MISSLAHYVDNLHQQRHKLQKVQLLASVARRLRYVSGTAFAANAPDGNDVAIAFIDTA